MLEPAQVPLHSYVMFSFGWTGALAAEYPKKEHLKYVLTNICLALTQRSYSNMHLSLSKKFSIHFDLLKKLHNTICQNPLLYKSNHDYPQVGIGTWVDSRDMETTKLITRGNLSSTSKNLEVKAIYFSTDTFWKLSKKEI